MLKSAIYCNIFLLLIMSIFFLTRVFIKNIDLIKIRKFIIIYIIYDFISFCLCVRGIVGVGFDFILLFPIFIMSFIIYIISICIINIKIKKMKNTNYNDLNIKKYILLSIIPIIVFIIPYIFELYVINNCNYLLKFTQDEIIKSSDDDIYIAIINNKPVTITLKKHLSDRKAVYINKLDYDIKYTDDIEISTSDSNNNKTIIENDNIKKIALDAKERNSKAKGAFIYYFSEENYAIITLTSEEYYGTKLGEYFYYNNTYIKSINTRGYLETITYYK